MTLVIGRRFDDLTYLIADTGSQIPLTNEAIQPFSNPLAKILVSKTAAIAYSGNTFYLPQVRKITKSPSDPIALVEALLEINRRSKNEIDFLVVLFGDLSLTKIHNYDAERINAGHIGSHEAFTLLQEERHRVEKHQTTEFHMILLPETSLESDRNFSNDIISFNRVLERGLLDARGFAVPFFASSKKISFATYAVATRRPLASSEISANEPAPVNWQGAPEGAFSINFGGTNQSFACNIREGGICIEWSSADDLHPIFSHNVEWRFWKSANDKYGIKMIKRHGHPIDAIINSLAAARAGQFQTALFDIGFAIESILQDCKNSEGKKPDIEFTSMKDVLDHTKELKIPVALVGYLDLCLELRRNFLAEFAPEPAIEAATADTKSFKNALTGEFVLRIREK